MYPLLPSVGRTEFHSSTSQGLRLEPALHFRMEDTQEKFDKEVNWKTSDSDINLC